MVLLDVVTGVLLIAAILLCVPVVSEILQLILPPVWRETDLAAAKREPYPRLLFLIPAHNEEMLAESFSRPMLHDA